ncbi:MAG: OstA-like protein [Porphyromonadaceae bacterium]|nr:OstA-like protein [Porphyromonadaceae bacterium]
MKANPKTKCLALATAVLSLGSGYLGLGAMVSQSAAPLPWAQQASKTKSKGPSSKIILEHANLLTYDARYRPDVQRLIGEVSFRHGNATMTCDSAYLNDVDQTFEAFGNVHMIQADTINIYAKYLYYDGRTKLAQLRENVKLDKPNTTVYTDILDYDREANMAYYYEGGSVVDEQNTLTSVYGQFNPTTNDAEFRDNVRLYNDSTEMTTQTLYYNTQSRIARFEGETLIKADSGTIVSQRGVYDLNEDVGILLDRSVVRSGSRSMTGDSIYYDGMTQYGEAFGQIELIDTLQKANLYGDYGYFENKRNYAFATSRAYILDYSQKDSLYIGADTLELVSTPLPDSIRAVQLQRRGEETDQQQPDSLTRLIRAYHNVRVYKTDVQALADSMTYVSIDSVLAFYQKPIMWSESRQLSGDTILFHLTNQQLDYVDVIGNTFSIEQMPDAPEYYNQLRGANLRAYIVDSTLRQINVMGDVESIFYMKDEKANQYNGLNRMTSKEMQVFLDSGVLKKVHWTGEAHGKLYPMHMAKGADVNRIEGFNWAEERRPKSPLDVITQPGDSTSIASSDDYTLANLKRFSGAKAALKAYEEYAQKEADRLKQQEEARAKQKQSNQDAAPPTYEYVLRPKEEDEGIDQEDKSKNWTNLSWLYNPFLSKDAPEDSSTSQSTGMLVKKNLTNESSESDANSLPLEKSKEN